MIMTNKEWIKLHTMLVDAQEALNDLDKFHGSDLADNVDAELDAYAACVSCLGSVINRLEDLVKEKENVE